MREVFPPALAATLNPTLVAATTVVVLPNPRRLMLSYLLGAMMTSLALGLLIIFPLDNTRVEGLAETTISPAISIGLGAICLIAAFTLRIRDRSTERGSRNTGGEKAAPGGSARCDRAPCATHSSSEPLLTLPGGAYLAGLGDPRLERLSPSRPGRLRLCVVTQADW